MKLTTFYPLLLIFLFGSRPGDPYSISQVSKNYPSSQEPTYDLIKGAILEKNL